MLQAINEAASFIRERIKGDPDTAVILGTGLGSIVEKIETETVIDYDSIPHFGVSAVKSHAGKLISGRLGNTKVMAMQGRFHYYEGYTMQEITFPVRVMKLLGVNTLVVSNASGGLNPDFEIGDIMLINDHINLMPSPLIGRHDPDLGELFPDMSQTYDPEWLQRSREMARQLEIPLKEGCYVAVTGPALETPKEYQYLRIIGGDAVGMSTVPEAIVAHQMGIRILAFSVVTDLGVPGRIEKTTLQDVIQAAEKAAPMLTRLIVKLMTT
ncbi:MAG: purine-nucleoside phosphorylase [Bacteroidales bacterium]